MTKLQKGQGSQLVTAEERSCSPGCQKSSREPRGLKPRAQMLRPPARWRYADSSSAPHIQQIQKLLNILASSMRALGLELTAVLG